jgi:serine/threonine protein kinase
MFARSGPYTSPPHDVDGHLHVHRASEPMPHSPTPRAPPSRPQQARVRGVGAHDLLGVGEVLGETYEVRAKLGEGGMGQVYEAWDRALGRSVAIKVAPPHEKASLNKEARAMAALRHPSVVGVYALGEHDGVPYVAMERVPGKPLQAHLDARRGEGTRFAIAEVIDLLVGIAEGLAVVHRAGMAHRDVTPANLMLAPGDRVVLTDFGIFQPETDVVDRLQCAGSPRHMAPEAIAMTVDLGELYLVDVYALGVIAFELLTGALPFDDLGVMKILWLHLHAPIPDPAAARPDAPPRLAALVREMLAKDPKDRPQSMDAIAWRLRQLRSEAPGTEPSCSVLIVEDNAATAAIVSSIVCEASARAEVRVAPDGQAALEIVHRKAPDVLLVDVHLPGLSGIEVCTQLRRTTATDRCTFIATSAHATPLDIQAIRELGFVRYLPKGDVLATELPALIRAAERRAARRARP